MRLKNIIWKTVVMSLMASPLCISCDDDDEVTVNSKFYLSTKVFPVDSYEASLSVITSGDGIKWKSIGTVTISRSGTQYIKFSKAI